MTGLPSPLALALRTDLELHPARPDADGSDGWILHDPLQHRYFRIDDSTYALFELWQSSGHLGDAVALYQAETGLAIEDAQIAQLVEFASKGNLLQVREPGEWRALAERADQQGQSLFMRLAHRYLFFKLPLFHPQRALETALPFVSPLLSRGALVAVALIAFVGLFLVSRQWDQFTASMASVISPMGAIGFAFSLIVLKALHELGHAFMAVRFGCRVPVLGVAFMMLTPLLYSDVSHVWTLPSRRKRLLISGAGILVELGVAAVATLVWVFLPDGAARSIAFMMATTAWVMSVMLNLNPFMRFDGYYLLSDTLGVDNLQPRAFALGKWKLRQWLVAPDLAAPEHLPPRLQSGLIAYAWITWIYRLMLFTSIALMVYTFAFKLLGIVLFCLEIGLLIVMPLLREVREWKHLLEGDRSSRQRLTWTFAIASGLAVLLIIPLPGRVAIPAILTAADLTQIYAPSSGKITNIHVDHRASLPVGAKVISMTAPSLENEIALATIRRDLTKTRLGQVMSDTKTMQQSLVIRQELSSADTRLDGLRARQTDLTLTAPIDGRVIQIAPNLHPGRWIKKGQFLASMTSGYSIAVRGFISESALEKLAAKDEPGRFVPDDLQLPSFLVGLRHIAPSNSPVIDIPELSSQQEGPIAVLSNTKDGLVPIETQYRADLKPISMPFEPHQVVRGVVYMEAESRSILTTVGKRIARVLIRESGF